MMPNRLSRPIVTVLAFLSLGIVVPQLASAAVPVVPPRFDVEVREILIPMKDGVRLAANLYWPKASRAERFPVVLEYIPYRKDEGANHAPVHRYFAERGFASVQVDIRGTGRSEGHLIDREYSQREQEDAEQVIAWLARQPWSNGAVGMFGISWGGFNSTQLAMRNPPGLKAVIPIDATEDLFHDDVHFIDGLMHIDEYEINVDLLMSMTRSPDFPTDEASLAARFDAPPWLAMYKQHPHAGSFWDEPVRPLHDIRVPMFMIGGMLDGYRDSIPRTLGATSAPTKALLGPWNHSEPHAAVPGPAVEWRDQAVAWWDRWLRGRKNGIDEGPKLAVYMNHAYPPDIQIREIPGEWRAEQSWPPQGQVYRSFFLTGVHGLAAAPDAADRHSLGYLPAATQEGGGPDFWWGDVNGDQRSVDAYSLVYDSPPLTETVAMLGRPRACLAVTSPVPVADWFVRLSDVAPDGVTTLVSGAGLAGAQRDSARDTAPLVPGQEYSLCLDLHLNSWLFAPGHRLRVAVSNAMWPMIWPTPYRMTTALAVGGRSGSRIELPIVPVRGALPAPTFNPPDRGGEAESAADMNVSSNVPALGWSVSRDPVRQQATVEWSGGSSESYPWGSETTREHIVYRADDLHPEQSSVTSDAAMTVQLPGRLLEWRGTLDTHSDLQNFYIKYRRELFENQKLIRTRQWETTIPRDGQ
jgi:uncharacterized protein